MKKIFNTHSKYLSSSPLRKFVFVLFLFIIMSFSAMASHFRFGNISWTNKAGTGDTVTFTIQQAWRISYGWNNPIVVGNQVYTGGEAIFEFGDGDLYYPNITITSVDSANDWFYGVVTITHIYPTAGTYTAEFNDCCRILTLQNNAGGYFRVQTEVTVGGGYSSPVSAVTPIIFLAANDPNASFVLPASDPDGRPLSFRLATDVEASGFSGGYVQPTGLTVDANTGRVHFSTAGLSPDELYTTQIIVSDGVAETALDFIIQTVTNVGTPPYFAYPPTPVDGTTINAAVGQPVAFTVQANDSDRNDIVALNAVGLPVGATTTPTLPTSGNPVSAAFNWTPTTSDVGTYVIQYQATDANGLSATTNVILSVSSVSTCDSSFKVHVAGVPRYTVKGGNIHTIYKGYGLQRVALFAAHNGGQAPYTYQWSDGATSYIHVVSPDTTTTYSVTVTDAKGCTATCSITIYVIDVRCTTTAGNIFICNGGQTMSVQKKDVQNWLSQGATLGQCSATPLIASSKIATGVSLKTVTTTAADAFVVYPNPAKTFITLRWNTGVTGNAKVVITDLQGKTVLMQSLSGSSQTIGVSSLANGVYLAKIVSADKTIATSRFVVSK